MLSQVKIYKMTIHEAEQYTDEYCRKHFPGRFQRAGEFRFREDRLRSIGAGALLYEKLGLEEADIRIGEYGKLYSDACDLQFNLSHSGEYIVLAAAKSPVGVDIEKTGRMNEAHRELLADYVFTEEEKTWIGEGAAEERFMQLWTLKESATKALGCGMNKRFNTFSVLPLLKGEQMELDGKMLSGDSDRWDDYSISVCVVCARDGTPKPAYAGFPD